MISIIIPHFNRSLLLRETLHSVLKQTVKGWEIIIVDDGSTQVEWDNVKNYEVLDSRIKVYQRQSIHKGPSACRNEGADKANFSCLVFLDSDDLLKPFCLEQRMSFMESHPSVEIAVFKEENFKAIPGDLNSYFNIDLPYDQLLSSFLQNKNPWQTMAPIWKQSFFKKLGGFDADLIYMEDPELHIRALLEEDTKVGICYDFPADCFYRINFSDDSKKDFYYNSIYYRILFYDKIITVFAAKGLLAKYLQDIKKGIYRLIKLFMYSRINEFPELFQQLLAVLNNKQVFTTYEKNKIKWLVELGSSQTPLARMLKLKGLCYKMFPPV